MPTHATDWHAKTFQDAKWWRAEGVKWDRLAEAADKDGDAHHARYAREEAARCRQNAREKEVETAEAAS